MTKVTFLMDSIGRRRKYTILLFHFMVFNIMSSHESASGNVVNVSSKKQFADIVLQQHMLPSLYNASADGLPQYGTVSLHSHNRWRTQMAFSKSVYSFEVKEDTLPGTVVGKVETMYESLTPIMYTVLEDDGENLFLLSPHSGEFLLSRSLDFETQRFYILTVVLQQGDSHGSSVRVYFNVLNVNDNPPVFSQHAYSASLLEDTRVGTCFLSLNVSDKDDGIDGELNLSVIGGDEGRIFHLNPTGVLCLNSELDRERTSSYDLTVTANDCAQPSHLQFTSTTHVFVVVGDVNDNAPSFVSGRSVSVPEDAALHSVVMQIKAEDGDFGPNGEVLYYLNDTAGGIFSIDIYDGCVYLQETLDREETDKMSLTVTAIDNGSPQLTTTMNLTVLIEDANDNDPEFSHSAYSLTVREDIPRGTSLIQVRARDRDIGPNGHVLHLLPRMSPFAVDMVRGIVIVMDKLDRERESNYSLIITAVDQGNTPRSATVAISIAVLDINDVTPRFSPERLTMHVTENEEDLAQLTQQVSALDEDLDANGQLTYFIQNGNEEGLFSVSPNGTFQILQSLDREKASMYTVSIVAVDSGIPPLTGTLTIHVIVDDVNDNHPEFTEDNYITIVPENSPAGTVFAMIMASDIDEGVNGELRYLMENHDVPFAIEETSGELFTTDFLDREAVAIYRLLVVGSDKHPTHPLSSSVLVTVLIGDINDHWPQFLNSPYVAYVPTEMAPGSVVCAVIATDGDTEMNAELQYSLYGQTSDLFSINPYSGTLFTSSALSRIEDIIVNVHVEDAGENPKFDYTTISIRFQNVSDFPEIHMDVLNSSLLEDDPVGKLVAVVSAASSRAEPVSFYLASGNFEEVFHVHQVNGALTVENPLDYENTKKFTLLIEARDSGSPPFSSFAEIHIDVGDVNDNYPQFTQVEYRCEVLENSPPTWVCDVLAIDADSGTYGTVQYNITEGNVDRAFTIDPESGILSTTQSLDREYIPEYNLTVESTELDNPLHKDRATVIIVVLDTNDHAPRFSQIFITEVPEDTPIGHTIMQVISVDDDTGANAVITYSIIDESDDAPFSIDVNAGYVTVTRQLDRETQDHYVVKVNSNDSEWSVSTDVTIIITDVNDNVPVFADDFYITVIPETKEKEMFVTQVYATDADMGQNSEILYVIEPPNEEFWVNASSGDIYTNQPMALHDSASKVYHFTVVAFDCGGDPLHSSTTVIVRLEPYNRYPPTFLPFKPIIAVPYDLAAGSEVAQFSAIDQDFGYGSADIEYDLSGGNASDFFWIQPDDGKIMLIQSLAESMHLFFTLLVTARDQGYPPLSSQAEITFEITERNQFSPSFQELEIYFSVPEDLPVGSVIGKIQAEDADSGANGAIAYSIDPGDRYLPFSVGESSGLLTLIRDIDFEKQDVYRLQIEAADGGWVSATSTLNVTVIIMDVNDNPPVFTALEYITSVPENADIGTTVLHVKATDGDSGANAQITYSLIAGYVDKFAVDARNGTITTLEVFDYEQEQLYDITIKASDVGTHPLFSMAHVVIQISNINEFVPAFKKKEFNFSVFKNVPTGTRIGRVTATDDDHGAEGQVFYLLFGQNKHTGFDIDRQSGDIYTTGSLRKKGNSQAALKVLAKNAGVITGTDVDEAVIQISVLDMNDAPVFTPALYLANVTEDSAVGTSVVTVTALDQDSVLDWNRFFFSIENGNINSSFAINPSSGIILINSPLDREVWPLYNLVVTATDNGSPPATGTTNVIMTIVDVNDNPPKLTFAEAQVKENQPQGTIVARLNASDSDLPPNQGPFTYWFVNPSMTSPFSLTPDGVLFTTRPTDREQTPVHRLLLAVRDAGIPPQSSTAMFHINIVDENDNPPLPRHIIIEVKYFGSSFQGGMIGNVHPEDPDESDTFTCAIKSGQFSMFTIPNGTCELWSSPFQGEATYNITIEATDQLHFPVNISVYVNYKGFTNATMNSCVLFYVVASSMEEFLTHKYVKFVKALDSLFNLQASKTHVFGIKRIGTEILLLAAVKNYNGQYLSREVASGISVGHRKLLETQSNVTISLITSNPCLTNPCQNGATCSKNIYIGQDVSVLESKAVIFVSPQKEIFNCTCPAGFTGTLCEADIDECEANPCENEGTCLNTPGAFYCHCHNGFSGLVCSADVDECLKVKCQNGGTCTYTLHGFHCQCAAGFEGEFCEHVTDHCKSSPCVDGICINSPAGFSCHCPFGISGVHCEEYSYGFEELSFMEFPPLDRRANLIALELATVQRNSLLLHNPGGSNREFFALEILDGAVQLSYDLGAGPVKLRTNKQVADGHFHNIAVGRIGNMGSLQVDNCTDDDSLGFCFSQNDGSSSERTLDVGSSNMTFGGLRSIDSILLHPAHIQTHDFVGCIRNIYVNGILLRPSMALVSYNVLNTCPRATSSPCHSNPCKNGGVCRDLWSHYLCECKSPFTGSNCAKEISEELVLRLNGSDYIEYVIKERFKRDYLLRDVPEAGIDKEGNAKDLTVINVKFKTQNDGVLIHIVGQKGYSTLKIEDKKPVYVSKDSTASGHQSEFTVDAAVADGVWHDLSLFNNGQNTFLHLDGKEAMNTTDKSLDLSPVGVDKFVLGAAPGESNLKQPGFTGCVQYFNVSSYTLPLSGHSEMVEVWPSSTLVEPSCSSPASCLPSPCSEDDATRATWRCEPAVQKGSCVCLHNVSHQPCDVCVSRAENYDECSEAQASSSRPLSLWFIAVIVPVFLILIIVALLIVIMRKRRQTAKCLIECTLQEAQQGSDNAVFALDDGKTPPASVDPGRTRHDQQRSKVKLYPDVSVPSVQPGPKSDMEYYEVGSICSPFHSDTSSLRLSWQTHQDSTRCARTDPKRWADLKTLLPGLKKQGFSEDKTNSPTKPQNATALNEQLLAKLTHAEQRQNKETQQTQPGYTKPSLTPERLEPVQCLTFEEIRKLNIRVEPKACCLSNRVSPRPRPLRSTAMPDVSSDSETDSTFTCSDTECRQNSVAAVRKLMPDRSACSFRQQGVCPVHSGLKHTCCSADSQALCASFERWENILNMHPHFSTFIGVFEDIARLPIEKSVKYDVQSDKEEII